jgi:putative transcriptional regulator
MFSKKKPLSKTKLDEFEAQRDLATELLESIREMRAGEVKVVLSPVPEARNKSNAHG